MSLKIVLEYSEEFRPIAILLGTPEESEGPEHGAPPRF
jgi:hypothetical protein